VRRPASGKRQSVGGPERSGNLPVVFIVGVVAVVLAFVVLLTVAADSFGGDDPSPAIPSVQDPTETASAEAPTSAPSNAPATTAPTTPPTVDANGAIIVACGDILAPLDKQHRLERSCVPSDLQALPAEFASGTQRMRAESRNAMVEFLTAAKQAGYAMYINSSFRSFEAQSATYDFWVREYGKEYADRTSARPGHSEHQMGTTADIGWQGCELECTIGSPEADWIAENAYKFGFIVSYPQGKEQITGYAYEPWHVRYVGKATALEVHNSGLTLHEFLLK
jgi:D-alanyl-D-alanine carboxypeptidase